MNRRTLIMALSALLLSVTSLFANAQTTDEEWNLLIKAISAVESGNNPKAVNGHHAGLLQIAPVCVRECNRIVGYNKYSYNDRFSAEKSIEMFNVIQSRYNPERDLETAARLWNGGMGGVKHPNRTNGYWNKVKRFYEKLKNP